MKTMKVSSPAPFMVAVVGDIIKLVWLVCRCCFIPRLPNPILHSTKGVTALLSGLSYGVLHSSLKLSWPLKKIIFYFHV